MIRDYFAKMKGLSKGPSRAGAKEIVFGLLGSCLAMLVMGLLHYASIGATGLSLLVAPFGASAVLVFGAFRSPFAQPRNVIGGHVVSALIGVTVYKFAGANELLAICCSVPLAIAAMQMTKTLHPPGGATAFVAATGSGAVHSLGYLYVLTPCAAGAVVMILIGLLFNNIPGKYRYPQFWL